MNAWGITIILLWTISVNGQNTFVRILEQGEIKGLERAEGDNFLIAGTKRGRDQDLFIASIDSDAKISWIKQFGTEGIDNLERDGFMKTSSNSFLLLQNSFNYIDSTYMNVVVHFNAEGETIWTVPFENEQRFTLKSIIELDTTFVVIGDDSDDVIVQYISKNGHSTKRLTFGTPERDLVKASAKGDDGFCIVGNHGHRTRESIFAIILDDAGRLIWKDTFETSNSNLVEDVIFLDGNWYIAGSTFVGPGQNNDRPLFYKIAGAGVNITADSIDTGELQDATPFKMAIDTGHGLVFVGPITKESAPNNWKGNHFYIGKLDENLNLQWSNIIEYDKCMFGCVSTAFWPHTVQVYDDFIISAGSYQDSMFIIRSTIEGTVPIKIENFDQPKFSIYPNPASSTINIEVTDSEQLLPDGIVYLYQDERKVLEREIKPNQILNIDCSQLSSGLYYVRIMDRKSRTLLIEKIIIFR